MPLALPLKLLAATAIGCAAGFVAKPDPNNYPTYGESGRPKNCRAVIQANIDGWRSKQFSATDALNSIDRNCGLHGYSWGD